MKAINHHANAARVKIYHSRSHTRKQKNDEKPKSPIQLKAPARLKAICNKTHKEFRSQAYANAMFSGSLVGNPKSWYQHYQIPKSPKKNCFQPIDKLNQNHQQTKRGSDNFCTKASPSEGGLEGATGACLEGAAFKGGPNP